MNAVGQLSGPVFIWGIGAFLIVTASRPNTLLSISLAAIQNIFVRPLCCFRYRMRDIG